MRENGLVVRSKRGFRVSTTKANPGNKKTENILNCEFTATTVNEK